MKMGDGERRAGETGPLAAWGAAGGGSGGGLGRRRRPRGGGGGGPAEGRKSKDGVDWRKWATRQVLDQRSDRANGVGLAAHSKRWAVVCGCKLQSEQMSLVALADFMLIRPETCAMT